MQTSKADIIFGFIVTAVAGMMLWQSLAIVARFANRFTPFYYTPGFVPLLLSGTLIVLGVTLVVLKRAAFRGSWKPGGSVGDLLAARGLWAALLIAGYVYLLPHTHFLVATALFLFLSISIFYPRHLLTSALVTAVATFGTYFVFARLFILSLP